MKKRPVGGFFELETGLKDKPFHTEAHALSNGRACLYVILEEVKPSKVHIPFYCCDAILEPLHELNVAFEFYAITEQLEPVTLPLLKSDEMFLYINYFGLKREAVERITNQYTRQSIIDNTQAFFEKGCPEGWSFNSARKFFGVPDGGYLYTPYPLERDFKRNSNIHVQHLIARISGNQQEAYQFFQQSEASQRALPYKMSRLTERLLANVDYGLVKARRVENFGLYEDELSSVNRLPLPVCQNQVPFCYPFLPKEHIDKGALHKMQLYIAMLWKDVGVRNILGFEWEHRLANQLLPLPVDHRLNNADARRVLQGLKTLGGTTAPISFPN